MRPQRQVKPEHKTMFSGLANQGVNRFDLLCKILVVRNAAAPRVDLIRTACRLPVVVVNVNQIDVAGHIEFTRAQLAHAHHPHLGAFTAGGLRRAVLYVQHCLRFAHGHIKRQLSQLGHGARYHRQRSLGFAVEDDQALHHQLTQYAQGGSG